MIDELTQGNHPPYQRVPRRDDPPLYLRLRFDVRRDGQPVPRPPTAPAAQLSLLEGGLVWLLIHPEARLCYPAAPDAAP